MTIYRLKRKAPRSSPRRSPTSAICQTKIPSFFYGLHRFLIGRMSREPFFDVLQFRHDDETDDDEQKPGADFAEMDQLPARALIGVVPGAEKRRDVLGNPDEKANQKVGERDGHPKPLMSHAEMDLRTPEHDKNGGHEHPTHIPEEVVGKEIKVNGTTQYTCVQRFGPPGQGNVQTSPGLT